MTSAGGCGLINSDITSIKFNLPPQHYSFDTAQAGANLPNAPLPSIDCADDATCCSMATLVIPGIDCSPIVCDAATNTCALTATIETPPQKVNLKAQAPELSGFSKQSVIDITVSKISYEITNNTLNVDLPVVELFVAADGATSTGDATAKRFGTTKVIPAMDTTPGTVTMDAAGQKAIEGFAHNFGTPFVFLGRTTLLVPGGKPLPSGAIALTITGQLSAKPGL
jgi:hypothetical protein